MEVNRVFLGRPRQLTQMLGAGSWVIERGNELRANSQQLAARLAIEAARKAPDAGGFAIRKVLRQTGLLTAGVESHDAFRDRLETFEEGVGFFGKEIETDPQLGMVLGLKWIEIAKTQKPDDMLEPKTDLDYICDYAYVLQRAEVSEQGIQRIFGGMQEHFLKNDGNIGVAEGKEPLLPPMTSSDG